VCMALRLVTDGLATTDYMSGNECFSGNVYQWDEPICPFR
jgi:hypothetical protein